jgi:hypothetical protein
VGHQPRHGSSPGALPVGIAGGLRLEGSGVDGFSRPWCREPIETRRKGPMQNRRGSLLIVVAGFVALAFIVGTVIADELIGVMTKVDVENKKITVVEKDTDKEIEITITDETEQVKKSGNVKVDLEKLSKGVERAKEKGRKGVNVVVTHEKKVASKIEIKFQKKKKAAD